MDIGCDETHHWSCSQDQLVVQNSFVEVEMLRFDIHWSCTCYSLPDGWGMYLNLSTKQND